MKAEKRLKFRFLLKLSEGDKFDRSFWVELMLNYIDFLIYYINYGPVDNKVFLAQYKISYSRILIILWPAKQQHLDLSNRSS